MSEPEAIEPTSTESVAPAKPRKRPSPNHKQTISNQVREVFKGWSLPIERIAREAKINQSVLQKFMAGKAGLSAASLDLLAVKYKFRLIVDGTRPADDKPDKPDKSKGKSKAKSKATTRRKPSTSTPAEGAD